MPSIIRGEDSFDSKYDNSVSKLQAETYQGAIDELVDRLITDIPIDSIGTSAHGADWAGAIDTDAPEYNPSTHKARWVEGAWDIRTIAEWDEILNPEVEDEA